MGANRTGEESGQAALSPSEAFALLSNDTRLAAMEVPWEANEALRFTELADRADVTDTGNLNYHLGQIDGWFIRREDSRYGLTYLGRQIMTPVMTGDITDQPALEPTRLVTCDTCGQQIAAQLALSAVTDPTVVAFFIDHGIDLLDPTWESARRLLQGEERVHSTDPLEATVVWTADGESLRIRVGADGEVLDVDRSGSS